MLSRSSKLVGFFSSLVLMLVVANWASTATGVSWQSVWPFKIVANRVTMMARAAETLETLQAEIDELAKLKKMSEDATGNLEKIVDDLETKIKNAQAGITKAKQDSIQVAAEIEQRETDLAVQYQLLSARVVNHYKRLKTYSPVMVLLATERATDLTKNVNYNNRVQAQDSHFIESISQDLIDLEQDKKNLEARQVQLAAMQTQLDDQKKFFDQEIAGAKAYQQQLTGKIADLSAKQQSIINARSGSTTTSVGDVPLADDFNASIAYKAQAPGDSFAVFSFGAYTHRHGMSQYGAKARAEAGQSTEEILKAYYPGSTLKKDYSEMGNITVNGVGSISFEGQYLQGIYEMPGSWNLNALKAQAVAARTYAIKYTNNGQKSICSTEACQVFKNSKKGGDWEKAVNETKKWVLVDGSGQPISTQYASTHGGYNTTSGWDLSGGYNASSWTNNAWEKKANSPWFYKAWYRSGYTASGANCGRNHPWLSQQEFSDIINAWIVRQNPNGADADRIQPVTINQCQVGGEGGNPYSMDELKKLADKSGGAVTKVSSVSVSHNSDGQTTQVSLSTNRGKITISGSDFKTIFNLRAPGYLRIPQSGFSFFNIEHKN